MPSVLLDTSVASLLHPRRRGSSQRARYERDLKATTLAISFQTVAELWSWAEENRWGVEARTGLEGFIAQFVIVPYTPELAQTWARLMAHARRAERRLEAGDGWIASSAVLYGVSLLTNDRDFVGLDFEGLDVICRAD